MLKVDHFKSIKIFNEEHMEKSPKLYLFKNADKLGGRGGSEKRREFCFQHTDRKVMTTPATEGGILPYALWGHLHTWHIHEHKYKYFKY